MSQVETVALWAGLIASIAGIVLSVVATVFALWVGRESAVVNQQMIRSLQKIESTVEHLSADTRELITAGWNKMLTGLHSESHVEAAPSDVPEKISQGIASEIRSEMIEEDDAQPTAQRIERVEEALRDLRATLTSQFRPITRRRYSESLTSTLETIRELPVESRAVLSVLSQGHHLTRKQYLMSTRDQSLGAAVKELRSRGLLVPLEGLDEAGKAVPVYYLPPNPAVPIELANRLVGEVPKAVLESVSHAMRRIGYDVKKRESEQ